MNADELLAELKEDGYTIPEGETLEAFYEAIDRAFKLGQHSR